MGRNTFKINRLVFLLPVFPKTLLQGALVVDRDVQAQLSMTMFTALPQNSQRDRGSGTEGGGSRVVGGKSERQRCNSPVRA